MEIGKVKPLATLVAQFPAGVEVEAIQHEGKLFLPCVLMGDFAPKDSPDAGKPVKPVAKKEPVVTEKEEDAEEATVYEESALMELDVKALAKILKDEFEINPDDFPGKNTNKKLRMLILDNQGEDEDEDEAEEEAPEVPAKKTAKDAKPAKSKKPAKDEDEDEDEDEDGDGDEDDDDADPITDAVVEALEAFDAGTRNKKKTIATICALSSTADADKITELVEEFSEDADADIDASAKKITDALSGKAAPKKAAPAKTKEKLVEASELTVGQRVSVWWEDNKEWFDGTVKSVKKGKVVISYDDDTEDAIDPDNNTKIKLIK